jgi:putative nucleotidyltransferase with HDIG domain
MFHRTQLLLDKADAFAKEGHWRTAIDLCESLFQNSWRSGRLEDLLESLLRLGLLYSTHSESGIAAEYFELVLEVSRRNLDALREARALNSLGVERQRAGDIEAADTYFQEARAVAAATDGSRTRGDIEVNLGIIATIRGELFTALTHYSDALEEYRKVDHPQRVARVLNNLGMLYTDLKEYKKAESTLGEALHICREIGDVQVEGIVLTNRTELMLALGKLDGARADCDAAYEISQRIGDASLAAELVKSYGVICRETGDLETAEARCNEAIALSVKLTRPLIEAEANRELALVLRGQDRNREALAALNRAHALFTSLQAKQEQADIDKRFQQLESDFLSLVALWGESIEAKDRYTRGHCQRVAEYACQLAERAAFPQRDLVWFRMGAFLHDLGKTEVPEEVLNKPGRLTDDERRVMERHTVVGDEMLATIEFPWDIRPMVRSHHERWDGRGYPDKLEREWIPFSARILHIADVFDALTTTRSYRQPLSPSEAFDLMAADNGSFDPELFRIFEQLLPEFAKLVPASPLVGTPD